jgi:hypothetical protein
VTIIVEQTMLLRTRKLSGITTAKSAFVGRIQQKLSLLLKKFLSTKKAIVQARTGTTKKNNFMSGKTQLTKRNCDSNAVACNQRKNVVHF